ncbi:MAG: hypothetical protein FJ104_13785, partial [Deltaproteobacteria bacterium]|nr:hypothetical protein [Deltaproteobacteria bacterium]
SGTLLAAALGGLLATLPLACSEDSGETPGAGARPEVDAGGGTGGGGGGSADGGGGGGEADAAADAPFNRVIAEDVTDTPQQFRERCDEYGGWVYQSAFCAGSGQCRGLFLLSGTLSEQSCRGMNGCGGLGCVQMPEDQGRTGKDIYETGGCENCHGKWSEDYSSVDMSVYAVNHDGTHTDEEAVQKWKDASVDRLVGVMVYGTQGFAPSGVAFTNMPSYRADYSVAEIRRTVEYLKTLPTFVQVYGDRYAADAGGGGGGH